MYQTLINEHLSLGRMVLIVNGAYRGTKATLEAINTEKFSVTVKLAEVRHVEVMCHWCVYYFF